MSLPACAGAAAASPSLPAPKQPQHLLATRTGIVYPLQLPPATMSAGRRSRSFRVAHPAAYRQSKAALDSGATIPEIPSLAALALSTTPTFSTNFAGLAFPDSQCGADCEPPDTQVAAGPNNIFEVINVVGKIYDKSGNTVLATFNLNHLFNMNIDLFSSDPRIEYDTISGRWFVSFLILDTTDITTAQNGSFNLAVSKDSNPLDGFFVYSIETPGDFPDQPSLGFNDDKIVTGGNSFSCDPDCNDGPYEGNEFLVWNKSELLAGDMTIDTDFNPPGQDTSDFPIIPAKSRSSTSTLWMLSAFGTEPNPPHPPIVLDELNIWSVTGVPGIGMGSSATDTIATITDFTDPPSALQKSGGGNPIDTGDQRLLDVVFRDGDLWGSGNDACKPSGDTTTRACLQYFEVLTGGVNPVVNQDFSFGTKAAYDYYPSVDLDSSDDLISSFSQSSSTEFASAFVDGRLAGDPVNTLGTPVLFQAGAQAYNGTRWGDYSGAGIDPNDQTAIWVAGEYATGAATGLNWGTWIAEARVLAGPTSTPTATATSTPTATATATVSATPTATITATPTISPTPTASSTPTASASGTPTTSATPTASASSTAALSPTPTATETATPTATVTATATQTATPTATPTPPFGTLSVSGNLSFGKVKVNSTASKKIKVKNKGKGTLQVTIGTLDPPFTVTTGSGTFNLAKGKTEKVTVQFKPTATGPVTPQILSISSDDPEHPSHNVTASGSGK
ncbi:choice-of-anchor D domain-containing protein [Candidatus Binatus sp.]|uniref:choice-of-anchor D domain-containing protein n=2 Tax=Candidatus Binatus sp. TaxID=2811406 RepID=UPI003C8397D8